MKGLSTLTRTKGGICMLKNLKKVAAIVLSFAMAVQFGLADSYYVNAVEEPVEPQQEETTTAAPQEQEEVPTAEEETPQQQEEQQQPAVEEEQPAAEEAQPQPQPQPVEQAEVKVSYVKEDDTDLMESVTATYDVGYRLDQDTNVFKEAHEAFEFEYAFVNGNKENKITKDQVKASGLTVTSDMTSLTLVYKEKASTEKPKKANKQEPAKTETTSESDDASDADTTDSQETGEQLTEFFVVASQNQVTKGETAQLTLTIKPDNYPNKDVTWSSSNDATATVDGNGLVTTHEVGTVTITATLKSDPAISSSVTIVVNPIKVSKITVNGYGKDYLVKGNTVTLTTTVEPSDAANKSIVWSSSNEEVATVDQNGKVTAVGQGTVSIKAMNDDSGVYGEQVITVYDNTPANYKVHVYVTNENQKTTYTINIPKDGTVVTPASVAQNTTGNGRTLVTKAEIRVLDELGSQPNWANISSKPIVTAFRYYNGKLQYKTTSNSAWATVGSNQRIYDFSNIQYKADETGSYNSTDVKVTIGDWPYGANASTSEIYKTIQIQVYNNETKKNVYDSGVMRYANGSNGNYGKVNFICDTSKYEVVKVERYFSNTSSSNYGSADKVYEGTIPSDLSVQFTSNNSYYYYTPTHEHYKFIAYVQAKTIHVKYDANSGTGAPKGTTVKSTEKVTVDSTTRPTREGYIFTGWAYGGRLYQGGESFDAPISDVTFVAQWAKASDVINYTVNDSKMGSVSRSYERIGETVQGKVQGSTAIAKTGYQFVKWVKGTNPDGDAVSTDVEYKPTTKGTYMAVFEAVKSDLVVRYVEDTTDGKEISASETKSYKYGESYTVEAKDIKGYRLISESPITGTKGVAREEIVFTYTQKKGKVVYNLGPNGSWGNGSPENVVEFDTAKGKWAYNYGFDKGDKFVVTESVPTSSDNAVFVGWYDKKRDATPATMRKVGDIITYPYTESSKTNSYTLDALWEKLQGANQELPYDGKKHSLDKFTVKFANDNLQGWTESASSLVQASNIQYRLKQDGKEVNEWGAMPSFKDAGVYTIEAKATVNGVELTAEATLTINPKNVTLTTEGATRAYNGQPLTAPGTITGFVEGEGAKVVTTKSQTAVGQTSNDEYNIVWNENTTESNYDVKVGEIGTLTVTAQSIKDSEKITVGTLSNVVYTGKKQEQEPAVTTQDGKTKLVKGTDYTLSYSEDTKNVGEVTVTVTGKGNYSGKVQRKYHITKAPLTVTTEGATRAYNGQPLTAPGTVTGFVEGENAELQVTGKQTDVGSSKNTYNIVWTETTKADNYQVSDTVGTLTVTAQSIDPGTDPEKPNPDYTGAKVNSPKDEVYDGNEHKWIPTVTDKADKKLKAGKDYTVEYSTKNFKDVGTIDITITGIGNYTGTVKRSYKVTPKEYTVTTDSATKTYSGTALTAGGKVEGIVSGETVEFTTTGSQTEVGTSKNTYELVWKSAKATNYTLAKESIGKLTVKAKSIVPDDKDTPESEKTGITVNEPSDSKYDGKEHKEVLTVTDTKTGKELVAGTDYSVTYSSDLVNAGTVKVTVAGLGNYSGSFTKTYKITKRSVTLTSATVSKVYDGSALTNTSISVSGDGFVEGEGASYEVTGSQTEVGNSANSFEYKLNEKTLASNYNITKVVGTLTITAAPAPVTPATPSTPSSTTSTTPRTPSASQVTTPAETVEKEITPKAEPKKEEKVEEEYTPKASPQYYWALINLICAILTVLFGLLLLISKRHKDEDDDEDDDETKQQTNNDDEENEQEKKRGLFTRVLAVLIAIVSVVFFLVTEDLSLPWTWTDQWTIWMVVIGLVQIVVFFVGRKWKNVDDEDEEEAQQA